MPASNTSRLFAKSPFAYPAEPPPRVPGKAIFFANVLDAMAAVAAEAGGNETGGKLLGKREHVEGEGWIFFVEAHLGPEGGGREVHMPTYFKGPGSRRLAAKAHWYFDRYGLDYLGEWHLHPPGVTVPSEGDRRALAPLLAREPAILAPILAPLDEGKPDEYGLNCYVLVTEDGSATFRSIGNDLLDKESEAPPEDRIPAAELEPYLAQADAAPDPDEPLTSFLDVALDHAAATRIRDEARMLLADGYDVTLSIDGLGGVIVDLRAGVAGNGRATAPWRRLDIRLDAEYPHTPPRWALDGARSHEEIEGWSKAFTLVDVVATLRDALGAEPDHGSESASAAAPPIHVPTTTLSPSSVSTAAVKDASDDAAAEAVDDAVEDAGPNASWSHRAKRANASIRTQPSQPQAASRISGVTLQEMAVAFGRRLDSVGVQNQLHAGTAPLRRMRRLLADLDSAASEADARARDREVQFAVVMAVSQLGRELPDAVYPLPYWQGVPDRERLRLRIETVLSDVSDADIERQRRGLNRLDALLQALLGGTYPAVDRQLATGAGGT